MSVSEKNDHSSIITHKVFAYIKAKYWINLNANSYWASIFNGGWRWGGEGTVMLWERKRTPLIKGVYGEGGRNESRCRDVCAGES